MLISRKGDKYFGQIPEKILLVIQEKQHELFRRNENNIELINKVKITPKQAKSGCIVDISTLENSIVSLTIPKSTQNNAVFPINGYGLPHYKNNYKRGNLLVTIQVAEDTNGKRAEMQNFIKHFIKNT